MTIFKIIENETTGDVHIKINSQYNNIKADKVTVDENIQVRLYGTINNLIIKKGAHVVIHGTVRGKVENSGDLYVYEK